MFKKLPWMGLAALCACVLSLALAAPAPAAQKNPVKDKQAKAMTDAAVKLIKAKGEVAFAEMNQKDGPWNKNGVSVFVCDDKGLELVSAIAPEQVGKNFWDYKDDRGVLVTQEEWKLAKAKGKGWIETMWTKPGETKSSWCRVYVRELKTGGKHLLVGAFYYTK